MPELFKLNEKEPIAVFPISPLDVSEINELYPRAVLFVLVVLEEPAPCPIKVFCVPVVLFCPALVPINVLLLAVVLANPAFLPIKVLLPPVVFA